MRLHKASRLLALSAILLSVQFGQTPSSKIDFAKDIEPVFKKSCYSCHGAKSQMGGLRLDVKKPALAGGESGRVIVPGKSAESLLYQRLLGNNEQERMPMGGKALDAKTLAAVRTWIDEGADWPETGEVQVTEVKKHWAFIPPVRPAIPAIKNPPWAVNPIDRFTAARLDKEELSPSPEADRVTLLRRLSLDLIGLPPGIEEVDAFLADKSPQAYEKQVDRLLNSPHYGERWGRHWLDAARYADSDGYEKDKSRQVWFYRDWVINAFNRDLPYNQFVIEQLAGDLLPHATQDQMVATGFLRNSMINEEGGIDPEQFRMEAMFDRMEAIGKGVLGVTIQCAQCHNHKFDPLKQEEYYRMFAFLNSSHEANIPVYTPKEQMKRAEIFRRTREIEDDLRHRNSDWAQQMAKWEATVKADQPQWIVLTPSVDDISTGGQKYIAQKDGSMLAAGYAPTKHRVKMTVKTETQNITAVQLELLNDPNLPLGGPGRSIRGTGALTDFDLEAAPADQANAKPVKVKIASATADLNLPEAPLDAIFNDKTTKRRVTGPIEFAIDGKDETAWGIEAGPGQRNQPRKAVFTVAEPISNPGGTVLTIYLSQKHGGWNSDDNQNNNLGRIRLSLTTTQGAKADPLPRAVRDILAVPRSERSPAQIQTVFRYWRTTVPAWKDANETIAELWRQHPEGSSQLTLKDREAPRETHILTRGDFLKPAAVVKPGVPAFLNSLPADAAPDRLTFAKWLVDRQSPTTARAMVNRIWQAYFGTGLISSSEDLGKQSEAPSHPELLDWLAVEFMERGWSMKAIHRLVVTSATYRQSSHVNEKLYERDPYNRLLARGPRSRVEAEIVRDVTLAASGLLDLKVGGPSVFPPAPEFLFQPPVSYGPKNWNESTGTDRYRRALYTFRYRSVPYPVLQIFDAPNGDSSCVRRSRSNTPLQALTTLNEPLFVESARALAVRTLKEAGPSVEQRLIYAFRRCMARKPTEDEQRELTGFLNKQMQRAAEGWLDSRAVAGLSGDQVRLPEGTTPVQLAAWTALSRVLLNLDETITKE
ncbi:MAG TPA: PSD1 and planctomycete cytochrome C domain-containing protein [Bryobacteraceae bacterium]|nr:PSD1 and planctomycete cytochrome C domain-containing protein [Bryobacteraceae bacterium]